MEELDEPGDVPGSAGPHLDACAGSLAEPPARTLARAGDAASEVDHVGRVAVTRVEPGRVVHGQLDKLCAERAAHFLGGGRRRPP